MAAKRLVERITQPLAGARVDREAGVIYGVKLCGFESANGRDYPAAVFRRDIAKYENAPINFNHGRERLVENVGGKIRNARVDADGTPRGDAHLLKTHPHYAPVMEAAENHPDLLGFSHVAVCRTGRGSNGREVVEGLELVESVDLVAQPATTKGFFEDRPVKISLKQFAERVGPKLGPDTWGALTKLCREMGDEMADAPVMDPPPDDSADAPDLKSALMSALAPMLDDAFDSGDPTKLIAALKDFIKLHAKHTGGDAPPDDAGDDSADDSGPPSKESANPVPLSTLFAECKAGGLEAVAPDLLEVLAATATPAARAAVIRLAREAKARPAEAPRSPARAPGAGEAGRKPAAETAVPTDAKGFAASCRN